MTKQVFKAWSKTECDICKNEFQVTRTEPKEIEGDVICSDCELTALLGALEYKYLGVNTDFSVSAYRMLDIGNKYSD